MALRKLERTFAPSQKEIRYLNKTFPEFRQSLVDFARVYYPDTYNDFNESSPGMMFIEMASYVGDVLSYYIDSQFRENLMEYAQEGSNVLSIARSFGYKAKPATSSTANIDVYQLCPALDILSNYEPDGRFYLKLAAGMIVSSPEYGIQFRTRDILDFSNPIDRTLSVYAVDGVGKPLTYLIKKTIQVVSGTVKTYKYTFNSPTKFSSITLPDANVIEIISVTDANGYTWHEVDYLAQDLIFDEQYNTRTAKMDESLAPYYILKIKKESRRFVTRYNNNFNLEINFGSGVLDDTDESINLDPNKIASDEYQTNLVSTPLDPADFLSSRSYGRVPTPGVEMTITYSVGSGIESNVPSNSINKVDKVAFANDGSGFSADEQNLFIDIQGSLAVLNGEPARGGTGVESVEEIRQNALGFFNAQNRLVTSKDYITRCFAMPGKFGGVSKVFVARDELINDIMRQSNSLAPLGTEYVQDVVSPNVVNLYVLGIDNRKKLVRLNIDTKNNLRSYLDQYRILTDQINILDAFIVNIGVNFKIVVYRNENMNEVLARVISAVGDFFSMESWDINEPIILNDLKLEIAQVTGVQTVTELKIVNKYKYKDGSDYENFIYDLDLATENEIIYPSLDPCIFELRYPERDIIGHASQ